MHPSSAGLNATASCIQRNRQKALALRTQAGLVSDSRWIVDWTLPSISRPRRAQLNHSASPPRKIVTDECVISEFGVRCIEAINLRGLTWTQYVVGIETVRRAHQALAAKDLVAAGDAARKVVCDVEDHTVAVGDLSIEGQDVLRYG